MPRTARWIARATALAVVLTGVVLQPAAVAPAEAADPAAFRSGSIISDALFFDGGAMTPADVQQFLELKRPTCTAGYVCLKDYVAPTTAQPAEPGMCAGYAASPGESAATIIAKVGASCGISQKALLVTLQKEQGLVTATAPGETRYRTAMGFGCPDTAPCEAQYYGFFNQVYRAARQFKRYAANPTAYSYRAGRTNTILFHPSGAAACGSSSVYIENQATAGLYIYTPYQPNSSALTNLYGTGDGCAAYGNRNFWRDYTDWFGSTQVGANLVRTVGDPQVYLVTLDRKHPVDDVETLDSLSSLGPVGYVSQAFLDSRPTGTRLGRFLRDRAGLVYLVDRGWLFQVRDCAQLSAWGARCEDYAAMQLSDAQMAGFVKGGALSDSVVTHEGKRFVVYGGQRHEAADEASLALAPVAPGPPIAVREAALAALPHGAPLVRPGLVVRDRSTGVDALVDEGATYAVAAGLTDATRLGAALGVRLLDTQSFARLPARAGTVGGVLRAPEGSLLALTPAAPVRLTAGQLPQAAAGAPAVSARVVAALGTPTEGPVFARTPQAPELFLAADAARRPVAAMETVSALLGSQPLRVVMLSAEVLAAVPVGAPLLTPGIVVKAAGAPELYLVDGTSTKVFVPSFAVLDRLGVTGWREVPATSLAGYVRGAHPLGTALACGDLRLVGVGGGVATATRATFDAAGVPTTVLDPSTCGALPRRGDVGAAPFFVRSTSSTDLALVADGRRRPVDAMSTVYAVAGDAPLVVVEVDAPRLAALPAGAPVLAPGRLVKAQGAPELYLVDGASRVVFLPSFEVSAALGVSGWTEVPASTLAAYERAVDPLSSAVSCGAQRYVGSGGTLQRIGADVVDSSGVPVTRLQTGTCGTFRTVAGAGPVFVKSYDAPTVYLAAGGQRRPVANMTRLYELTQGRAPAIAVVAPAALAAMPIGGAA
ncbi:hypothetical protein [Cellulomonas shaoxiangyii]|uniref:Uncharacterized protein n=1 Tax=Cellulomonas shaoxiangyii TaxID=2566013 RepID=A0A4P7SG22_9CELL|nr:hypothetical protein [Cellulomonas shaoxiangyii]QCB93129.1 hypothetical protein E5225_05750 [Cellulomonas shaoxiangyii]TGY84788.1 hypothetical protein E5226_09560 [Cellulomonas shaoxiangyii]